MAYFNPDDVTKLFRIGSRAQEWMFLRCQAAPRIAVGSLFVASLAAHADCAQQLQQLSTDLHGVALTETQKQAVAGMIDEARRFCWVHREEPALEIIAKARQAVGIKAADKEFDWETVPLESLERKD